MDFRPFGHTCVFGLQWGDEGKGKIVDLMVGDFDVVVRYSGGANAGHTIVVAGERFALHQLPSGIIRPQITNVIGGGCVIDPAILLGEIASLRERNVEIGDNLRISDRAHLVFPYHRLEDQLADRAARTEQKLGTTARGIGPCYADKCGRHWAIRLCDLLDADRFRARLGEVVAHKNAYLVSVLESSQTFDADKLADEYLAFAEELRPFVCDTTLLLHDLIADNRQVLFEGAQGAMLDVDHGTYPFVTSSNAGIGSLASGSGLPTMLVSTAVGVLKAYTTRVGSGPFPTELHDDLGDTIRERGHEYGTSTGRPRRCGWFDTVATSYAVKYSGATALALMHLDTLAGMHELKVCTGYRIGDQLCPSFPAAASTLEAVQPVYETLPGWEDDLGHCRRFDDLPAEARKYVLFISEHLGRPVRMIGVGRDREQIILTEASA